MRSEDEPIAGDRAKDHQLVSRYGHVDGGGRSDPGMQHAHEADLSPGVWGRQQSSKRVAALARNSLS